MPKLKVHSGTKDRVKITKNGKVRRLHANSNHFLQKKSAARKRNLASYQTMSSHDGKIIKKKLGST